MNVSRPDIGTGLWKFDFIYFIVTFSLDLQLYLAVICCLSFTMCESLLYHYFDSSLSPCISTPPPSTPFDPFLHFYPLLLLFSSLLLPSSHPPLLLPAPGSPSPALSPSCPPTPPPPPPPPLMPPHPPLPERLPCPTDTTRCSHPPKTTSNSQRHQSPQSVSQAASQPASQPSAST